MFKKYLSILLCSVAICSLTACSTSDDSSAMVEDGSSDAALGLDADGALTVGDPNSRDGFNGHPGSVLRCYAGSCSVPKEES